jgi:hypothetical protein
LKKSKHIPRRIASARRLDRASEQLNEARHQRLHDVLTEYAIEHLDWPETPEELDQYLGSFAGDDAGKGGER